MLEWLGIGHLFELSGTEAVAGFLAPLADLRRLLRSATRAAGEAGARLRHRRGDRRAPQLPAERPAGVRPRGTRVGARTHRDAAGLVLPVHRLPGRRRHGLVPDLFAILAVFAGSRGKVERPLAALWEGHVLERSFFNERFDVKMFLYVVGGTMLSLNALSGAAYHYGLFGADSNPGVFLYAAFLTFYVFDYFIFERVQLYTFDVIHEKLGFKMIWGGILVYGWLYILPLWGMAVYPDPGFAAPWRQVWLIGAPALFLVAWGITPRRQHAEVHLQALARAQVPRPHRTRVHRSRRPQDPVQRAVGRRPPLQLSRRGFFSLSIALVFGYFANPWAWTYFVFIVGLFIFRQRFDDKFCAEKYGPEKWAEYQARVRYRIIPGIY